ncbi:MAG: hypothetical protein LRZ98_01025 [Candidatus Pacebacteria bacterium]|nr:hypothetical protein [Candidatus Paceibacterota bacterium]
MTFIVILRHFLGIKTLGSFIPTILVFIFLTIGLLEGVFFFFIIIASAIFIKIMLNKFKILYLPRITIIMIIITIAVLLILFFAGLLGLKTLTGISFFPLLILIILAEKFVLVQIKEGNKMAFSTSLETLLITCLGYILLTNELFIKFLVLYPYIILLLIPINYLSGKFTGLRLLEYFRFKEIIKNKND